MTDSELFGNRRKAQEDEYFRKRERELIEKLQQRNREDAVRRNLAERTGVADEDILRDLQALGYTPETVTLLHIVPLLQMAWAEGSVSDRERELIIEAARARGIDKDSAAGRQLDSWLAVRPPEELFEKTLLAIGAFLQSRPAEEREAGEKDLLSQVTAIASASGGILGFGKVSHDEQQLLTRITQEMERARAAAPPPGDPRPPHE